MIFLARQRRAINYGNKYVISDQQLEKSKGKKQSEVEAQDDANEKDELSKVLIGFDPLNNAQDRLILYEVTGMRTNLDEFQDDASSTDSDEDLMTQGSET